MKKKANAHGATGTQSYARLHKAGLTLAQQSAVDLLAGGKNDTETAEALNVNRVTVSKWRLYDPVFQAELNRRRAELWGCAMDRLRGLVPKALATLDDALENGSWAVKLKAADGVLQLAQLPDAGSGIGPTDAEEIMNKLVKARRRAKRAARLAGLSETDRLLAEMELFSPQQAEAEKREARTEILAELEPAADGQADRATDV
jgi:hypothetical protein